VDEVISDAPWALDDQFMLRQRFDYLALDEGMSVDPACDKFRLKGYDALKKIGKHDYFLEGVIQIIDTKYHRESDSDSKNGWGYHSSCGGRITFLECPCVRPRVRERTGRPIWDRISIGVAENFMFLRLLVKVAAFILYLLSKHSNLDQF
jgi:hypothetical protein